MFGEQVSGKLPCHGFHPMFCLQIDGIQLSLRSDACLARGVAHCLWHCVQQWRISTAWTDNKQQPWWWRPLCQCMTNKTISIWLPFSNSCVCKFKLAIIRLLKDTAQLGPAVSGVYVVGKSSAAAYMTACMIVLAYWFLLGGASFYFCQKRLMARWHGLIVRGLGTFALASRYGFESKLGLRTEWRTAIALTRRALYVKTGPASDEMNCSVVIVVRCRTYPRCVLLFKF